VCRIFIAAHKAHDLHSRTEPVPQDGIDDSEVAMVIGPEGPTSGRTNYENFGVAIISRQALADPVFFGRLRLFFSDARHQQFAEALDLQLAVLEYGIMAQIGIETDILACWRFLLPHFRGRSVSRELVQARDRDHLIPIHPVETTDTLIAGAAHAPAEKELVLASSQAGPGVGADSVNEPSMPVRLHILQPDRMQPGVGHKPWPFATFQPGM
jgi:hypothetical protein